jgi:hypothetical protein
MILNKLGADRIRLIICFSIYQREVIETSDFKIPQLLQYLFVGGHAMTANEVLFLSCTDI